MVQYFPPPDCRDLLPPLLACLPTAFISPQPPPALLPLLTPILRQRVQLLAASATSPSDSWLPLLCWETEPAQRLVDIISDSDAFELHPVSGEIDFGDIEEIRYRRLDEETLQARVVLSDLGIVVVYQWCDVDQEGDGSGWRVSEIRPLDGETTDPMKNWFSSVSEADGKANDKMMDDALRQGEDRSVAQITSNGVRSTGESQDDGDDDYWAQYDKTPGETPATKSPAPTTALNGRARSTSEAEYYAQYAQVQPEMDNDDPSTNRQEVGESTLNGNTLTPSTQPINTFTDPHLHNSIALPNGSTTNDDITINQPLASSPRTRSSTVSKLEDSAESQSLAESAIMHHVSTSMKSLYRLCRSSGIEKVEFERMIKTEMDALSIMDEGE